MASSGDDANLPPDWIRKASRRCPTATYYFNTKTGKSTWIHPNLLEWASEGKEDASVKEKTKRKKKDKAQPKAFQLKDEVEEKKLGAFEDHTNDSTSSSAEKKPSDSDAKSKSESGNTSVEPQPVLGKWKPVTFTISSKAKLKPFLPQEPKPSTPKATKEEQTCEKRKSKLKADSPGLSLIFDGYGDEDDEKPEDKDATQDKKKRRILKAKRKGKTKKGKSKDVHTNIIQEMNNNPAQQDKKNYTLPIPLKEERLKEKEAVITRFVKKPQSTTEDSPRSTGTACELASKSTTKVPAPAVASVHELNEIQRASKQLAFENDDVTDMEVEEQEIIAEIASFRGTASHFDLPSALSDTLHSSSVNSGSLEALYFVVDTNVLIHDTGIMFLETLKSSTIDGKETRIVIPYTALQEMDGLKRKEKVGRACQSAIKWCHHHFETGDHRVQGQSYHNYLSTRACNQQACGDDLILDCCLQLKEDGLNVCLLSNDVNLRNKALMANISAVGIRKLQLMMNDNNPRNMTLSSPCKRLQMDDDGDYHMKQERSETNDPPNHSDHRGTLVDYSSHEAGISKTDQSDSQFHHEHITPRHKRARRKKSFLNSEDEKKLEGIASSLHMTLSSILETVMKNTFEDLWLKIVLHKPPWTRYEVFACWEKHWLAVMIDIFPREVKDLVDELKHMFDDCQMGRVSVSALTRKARQLYQFFEVQFHDHIQPLPGEFDDMTEGRAQLTLSTTTTTAATTPLPHTPQSSFTSSSVLSPSTTTTTTTISHDGVKNVKNMINLVGVHTTHYIALVLSAYGVQHNLPMLNTAMQMNREQAYSSGVNLRDVIYSLGTTMTSCLNEKNPEAILKLCHLLVDFWKEAKEPCPTLPFSPQDLSALLESQEGQHYFASVINELENLMNHLSVINTSATSNS